MWPFGYLWKRIKDLENAKKQMLDPLPSYVLMAEQDKLANKGFISGILMASGAIISGIAIKKLMHK
jgi:hypothetical protein